MKVLLVSHACAVGGIETFMLELSRALRYAGHECELFFFTRGQMEQYLPDDCVAHFGDLGDCLRLVRASGVDVVHAGCADWALGISAVRQVGAKLVITNHGGKSLAWTSATCDAFTGVSRWIAAEQQPLTDLPVQVVFNGIDTERFKAGADVDARAKPIVAWVGRGIAVEDKRIDKFAAIAPMLRAAGLRIWLAEPYGPTAVGELLPEATRSLREVAEFWGPVPVAEMPNFYRAVAASGGCLVATSPRESFGLALVEAQACGCPVIGPDACGAREVVRPEHGGVLYSWSSTPAQLTELVLATLGDAETMNWRRQAGAQHVRARFSLKRMAAEYLQVYAAAPYAPLTGWAGLRARLRLSPLLHWPDYIGQRWSPGARQYEVSRKLVETEEWDLAAAAARASWATCPTLFTRSERIAHLFKLRARGGVKQA